MINKEQFDKICREEGIVDQNTIDGIWKTRPNNEIPLDDLTEEKVRKVARGYLKDLSESPAVTKERFCEIFNQLGVFNNELIEGIWEARPTFPIPENEIRLALEMLIEQVGLDKLNNPEL